MKGLFAYLAANRTDILEAVLQHLLLVGLAVGIGLLLSFLLCTASCLLCVNMDRLVGVFSFFRLIPGVALLVIALPVLGVGVFPTVCSLTLMTIPPILINFYSGVRNIPVSVMESAVSLGLTDGQIFFRIQLPMALPFLILGVRTAAVDALTIATVASLMGAGGLGRYVLTGLSINNYTMVVAGSGLITMLAFLTEAALGALQRRIGHRYGGGGI